MPLVLAPILVILACVALIPFSMIQRFRMGTVRRRARRWVTALNLIGVGTSAALFMAAALISSRWIPEAPAYTLTGLGAGSVMGLFGTVLTKWEYRGGRLEYTPNRWLVLVITGLVAARVLYGFWRGWYTWQGGLQSTDLIAASGVSGSMAAGAVVLGYYLTFWAGVHRRTVRGRRTSTGPSAGGVRDVQ